VTLTGAHLLPRPISISTYDAIDNNRQTETSVIITPVPGAIDIINKPGSATVPFFGIEPAILDPVTGKVNDCQSF
jgi:acyl-coenzyme A synthetase/AMP-(fatty) acid ligase